jgi:hypothetical protein
MRGPNQPWQVITLGVITGLFLLAVSCFVPLSQLSSPEGFDPIQKIKTWLGL